MQFPSISDWLAGSFLNPDWFRKLARPILVTDRLSRQLTSSPYYSMAQVSKQGVENWSQNRWSHFRFSVNWS